MGYPRRAAPVAGTPRASQSSVATAGSGPPPVSERPVATVARRVEACHGAQLRKSSLKLPFLVKRPARRASVTQLSASSMSPCRDHHGAQSRIPMRGCRPTLPQAPNGRPSIRVESRSEGGYGGPLTGASVSRLATHLTTRALPRRSTRRDHTGVSCAHPRTPADSSGVARCGSPGWRRTTRELVRASTSDLNASASAAIGGKVS